MSSSVLFTLFIVLAVWRLTVMITIEDGPLDIFARLRVYAGVRYNDENEPYGVSNLARGILCFGCVSVWVSIPLALLIPYIDNIFGYIVSVLGISTMAIILNEITNRIQER